MLEWDEFILHMGQMWILRSRGQTLQGWEIFSQNSCLPGASECVTLLGNRVFTDVINLRWDHPGFGWAPDPKTGVLNRRERSGHRNPYREEVHMKIEAETEMMQPQAKGQQGLPGTTKARKRQGQILL